MQELFKLMETNRNVRNKYKLNLDIPASNQVTYGTQGLRNFRPKIWNLLSRNLQLLEKS